MIRSALRLLTQGPNITRTLAADPTAAVHILRDKAAAYLEQRQPRCPYHVDHDWEHQLHEILGVGWPCPAAEEFWALWPEALRPVTERGIGIGRGAFGGWGDGEPGLVRAVWCLVRHLRPAKVVETGVARGFTSRFILEALERNGCGHLWSIDRPPQRHDLQEQVGASVPDRLRERWSYVKGLSRQHLPGLLSRLGQIDLFIHDSSHTGHNVRFELDQA